MKQYPSIEKKINRDLPVYAFDKIDGSNIRAEWRKKNGFYKFGSRNCLIDENHPELGESIGLFMAKHAQPLEKIFTGERWQQAIAFFEFWGPNSFAGQHVDEPHDVILFDVNQDKKGFVPPNDFIKKFGHLGIPRMLHHGRANSEFEEAVKSGTLDEMTFEGVVCKGVRKGRHLTMFKIKSQAWVDKLREFCAGDEQLFKRLL